jgi:thiol-disulfide isomerase/thioredoxin
LYGRSAVREFYKGSELGENGTGLKLDMTLTSLTAGIDAPTGTGLTAFVPYSIVDYERNFVPRATERGLGDVEARVRQDMVRWLPKWMPRLALSAGAAAPSGNYLARQGESKFVGQATVDSTAAREVSIGRGVWWALADLDASGPIWKQLSAFGGVATRMPVTDAIDGFRWGMEARVTAGLRHPVYWSWLVAGVQGEWLKRGRATEVINDVRQEYPNAGGEMATVAPMLAAAPWPWLTLAAVYRVQVWRDVVGEQGVPEPSLFVSVGVQPTFGAQEPQRPSAPVAGAVPQVPEVAAVVQAGQVTLVDYWATWCEPCQRLTVLLDQFTAGRPDVVVRRIDASDWDAEAWARILPSVAGLPVIDVHGRDRCLVQRLEGDAAFRFAEHVPAPLPESATPVASAP